MILLLRILLVRGLPHPTGHWTEVHREPITVTQFVQQTAAHSTQHTAMQHAARSTQHIGGQRDWTDPLRMSNIPFLHILPSNIQKQISSV